MPDLNEMKTFRSTLKDDANPAKEENSPESFTIPRKSSPPPASTLSIDTSSPDESYPSEAPEDIVSRRADHARSPNGRITRNNNRKF